MCGSISFSYGGQESAAVEGFIAICYHYAIIMIALIGQEVFMAQILVRNLDKSVVERLKKRAKENNRSLQAEVKTILEQTANSPQVDMETAREMIEEIRSRFKGRKFPDSAELIREDRDR